MLSHIYRIVREFQKTHHCLPNVLYLNKEQFHHLRNAFTDPDDIDAITRRLKMHIIICHDATHPHLASVETRRGHSEQLPEIRTQSAILKKGDTTTVRKKPDHQWC